jgi:hypothetical protein
VGGDSGPPDARCPLNLFRRAERRSFFIETRYNSRVKTGGFMRGPFRVRTILVFSLFLASSLFILGLRDRTPAQGMAAEKPFVIEYYYKTKWGHADEFITLFRKNHYPVLKKEVELGRMLKVSAVMPVYHTTEDGRWDYRVTIVYKNAAVAHDNFDSAALIKQMYPDQETYKKEEQRRFEILEAHWDLPVKDVDLDAK